MLRTKLIHILGGIMPAERFEDAYQRLKASDEEEARQAVHEVVREQLNFISSEDIFQRKKDGIYLAGEKLTPEQAQKIEKDAETFQDSLIWRALKREIDYVAYHNGFIKAQTEDDMLSAKTLVYLKDVIDTRIRQMRG